MSYYYQYGFISPEVIYSVVKEELKSYFDTASIDDLMFSSYVDKCLRKLGKSSYPIYETILHIKDFKDRLPDNFIAVREAWMCTEAEGIPYQSANSFYSQNADPNIIFVCPQTTDVITTAQCNPCDPPPVVYKTNNELYRSYRRLYLLKPGNISAKKNCDLEYTRQWEFYNNNPHFNEFTPGDSGYDSFDIRDNKFVTNFRCGIVHLVFYASETDDIGNQLVPDNYRVREYIEAFLKYKMFETLTNQTNDETFNQLQQKLVYYKQLSDEAYILAEIEVKKATVWQKQRNIKHQLKRLAMYELPTRSYNRWRRNN